MTADLADRIVAAVRGVLPEGPAALHEPEFGGREKAYVESCLNDGWVSTAGPFVERFERQLAAACGRAQAVACVNGTAALHAALMAVGVRTGDQVLVPALTFVATANAVHHAGAVPHFVDCEESTLGLCPDRLARHLADIAKRESDGWVSRHTGRRLAAIVPVHIFGHAARMPEIVRVAQEYGLPIVEDATEALGSRADGEPVGRHGVLGIMSFNGNKIVTTGGGGAITADDPALAARIRHLTTTAKRPHRWAFDHDEVGYNYRMPNINAALGCAQLEQLDDFVGRKRRLAAAYDAAFAPVSGVRFFRERPGMESNYWLNAILLDPEYAQRRDEVLARLNDAGVQARPVWTPMHLLQFQSQCPRDALPVTESIASRLINLPSSPKLANRLPA